MSTILTKAINNVDCHALKLFRNVASLFENIYSADNLFSDIKVIVENKTFYCHKLMLQINSEYLAKQIMIEHYLLKLKYINPEQFYEVLQFIYTVEVLLSTNNIESLLSAACQLEVPKLIEICLRFLADIINKNDENRLSHAIHSKLAMIFKQ